MGQRFFKRPRKGSLFWTGDIGKGASRCPLKSGFPWILNLNRRGKKPGCILGVGFADEFCVKSVMGRDGCYAVFPSLGPRWLGVARTSDCDAGCVLVLPRIFQEVVLWRQVAEPSSGQNDCKSKHRPSSRQVMCEI